MVIFILTLIIGEIEQLLTRKAVSGAFSKSMTNIRSNSNHILQLVNELLDFRKLESEELKLKMAEGNLVKFIKEITLSFDGMADQREIDFGFIASSNVLDVWYDRDTPKVQTGPAFDRLSEGCVASVRRPVASNHGSSLIVHRTVTIQQPLKRHAHKGLMIETLTS